MQLNEAAYLLIIYLPLECEYITFIESLSRQQSESCIQKNTSKH